MHKYTDTCLEELYKSTEDATMIEDLNGNLVLNSDCGIFKKGTSQVEIWAWFNKTHSKGIQWLHENGV